MTGAEPASGALTVRKGMISRIECENFKCVDARRVEPSRAVPRTRSSAPLTPWHPPHVSSLLPSDRTRATRSSALSSSSRPSSARTEVASPTSWTPSLSSSACSPRSSAAPPSAISCIRSTWRTRRSAAPRTSSWCLRRRTARRSSSPATSPRRGPASIASTGASYGGGVQRTAQGLRHPGQGSKLSGVPG